jgi:hypothetical protein
MNTFNSKITKCGIEYIAHTDTYRIMCYGNNWGIDIPMERIREFRQIFPEFDWEDGTFLEDIKGTYVRVTYDDNFNVVALHHIVDSLTYKVR